MRFVLQTINYHESKVRLLFDVRTTLPLLWVSLYLEKRSLSTQMQKMSAIKIWYDYWLEKHGTTFCFDALNQMGDLCFAIRELPSFVAFLESKGRFSKTLIMSDKTPYGFRVSKNVINTHVASVCSFLRFLTDRYMSSAYIDKSPFELRKLKSNQILDIETIRSSLTSTWNTRNNLNTDIDKHKSLTPKMMNAVLLITRPTTSMVNNELNPWKSNSVQWRNYIMIRLLDHYGLRAGELLLLTLDSIKRNLSGGYSMVVTSPLEKDPRKATNLAIKNEFSHRTLALSEHDYRFIKNYILLYRGAPDHRFLFTSTWDGNQPLS